MVDTITDIYEQGDPSLLAFTSILNAQTPSDITASARGQQLADPPSGQRVRRPARRRGAAEGPRERGPGGDRRGRRAAPGSRRPPRRDAGPDPGGAGRQGERQGRRSATARTPRRWRPRPRSSTARRCAKAQAAGGQDPEADPGSHPQGPGAGPRTSRRAAAAAAAKANHGGAPIDTNGLLMRPVNGPVTSPFGYRVHPIYHYWGLHDGDDFGAPCGAPLAAVRGGKVLTEYYSSVWGNRLYLNVGLVNGKFITVIYNHLSRYTVGTGAVVKRGQTRRVRRHHRLVDRLPPALHGDGERQARRPDEVLLGGGFETRLSDGLRTTGQRMASREDGGMPKEQGRKLIASNRRARHDYHLEDTYEAGLVLVGHRGQVAAAGARVAGRRVRRHRGPRGLAARRAHPGVHPGHLDQPLRPAQAQAAAQPRRDRQDRAQGQREGLHDRADGPVLQGRPGEGRDRARQGQEDLGQAPVAGRRGRPTARRSRPSGGGSRAWIESSPTPVEETRAFWQDLGLPGLFDVHVHFLPANIQRRVWEQFDRAGPKIGREWPVRYRQLGRGSGGAAARPRRTPLLGAAVRAPARRGDVPERLGPHLRRRGARVPVVGDVLPGARGSGVRRGAGRRGRRGLQGPRSGRRVPPRRPAAGRRLGAARGQRDTGRGARRVGPGAQRVHRSRALARVLARWPRLAVVVAHLGAPEYDEFLSLAERFERVHLDTTMVFTDFFRSCRRSRRRCCRGSSTSGRRCCWAATSR